LTTAPTQIRDELQSFARTALERRGGLVDWPDGASEGVAIVPPDVAAALAQPGETIPLTTEPGKPGVCVNLAADFLETAARVLAAEPRIGDFSLADLYLKRGTLDSAVQHAFGWLNAKVTTADTRSISIDYHCWWFRVAIRSEDRWETRVRATINSASGVEVDLPDPFELWGLRSRAAAGRPPEATYEFAARRVAERIQDSASEFFRRMDARLDADRRRLRGYYGALVKEADHKRPRSGEPADPEKQAAKKRAVDLELRRKLGELDERYAMEAVLEPLVLVRMEIPVLAVDLAVQRRRARRVHSVYWNPLLKQLEPIRCSRCGNGAFALAFTDEEVEPLCPPCSR
jgi:hypothetical protein